MTREDAQTIIHSNLVEIFEIDPEDIKPESQLMEDLDLDSIDAVDMMVQLQDATGKKVTPEQFEQVKTVDDLVTLVQSLHG